MTYTEEPNKGSFADRLLDELLDLFKHPGVWIVILIIGIILTGLSGPSGNSVDYPTEQGYTNAAISSLSANLRDPDSLELKLVHTSVIDKNRAIVCGMFNAKNGFGGYSGFKPFIAMGTFEAGSTWAITYSGQGMKHFRQSPTALEDEVLRAINICLSDLPY